METRTVTTARMHASELCWDFLFRLIELAGMQQLRAGQHGPTMTVRFWSDTARGIIFMDAELRPVPSSSGLKKYEEARDDSVQ